MSALHAPIRHPGPLALGQKFTLDGAALRALALRQINVKEAFTLIDGAQRWWRASFTLHEAARGEALVYEELPSSPESPVEITLLCAVLGRQRMLTVIQKATELGVMHVLPVISARSVQATGLEHEKAHAWPAQAVRAARQCRRASLPEVRPALPLAEALNDPLFRGARYRCFLDDRSENEPPRGEAQKPGTIAFVVGPEGGFSDDERALLREKGALARRLGVRVLRAETAVLAGLSVLQYCYGDLG